MTTAPATIARSPQNAAEPAPHGQASSGLLARLASVLPSLRESERKIAEYVLAHASEVVYLSITELADRTGTSEVTSTRMRTIAQVRRRVTLPPGLQHTPQTTAGS